MPATVPGDLLTAAAALTDEQAVALAAAWDMLWHADGSPAPAAAAAARAAALAAGRDWDGARREAWNIAFRASWPVSGYPVRRGISDAVHAVLVRDLISDAEFAALYAPWQQAA
jgi:hypothetical protein